MARTQRIYSNKGIVSSGGRAIPCIVLVILLTVAVTTIQQRSLLLLDGVPLAARKNQDSSSNTFVASSSRRLYDFEAIGLSTGTDKVEGPYTLPHCLKNLEDCPQPQLAEPKCRTGASHFYHTMYNARLGPLFAGDNAEPFQMLEIGFFNGRGFDAFRKFMPRAEAHSLEISCLPGGPQSEGKWPYGNFAAEHAEYQQLIDSNRLHCGDANDYDTLVRVWSDMRSPSAPPLKLVIDDGAHISEHMAKTVFFWFPRLAPGGLLVVEDIQPIAEADAVAFRNHFLPQVFKDVHYCGDPAIPDQICFPTLHKFMQSVHCEMHICIFERNDVPAEELSKEESLPPAHVFNAPPCLFGVAEDE
ncbi:hypothetical protein MPSEU_000982200 [Mayamaea pseudoterrestris]|nr:hypothetical protein MPSEU_000982200 [Mayamaea pseudoterrestris]